MKLEVEMDVLPGDLGLDFETTGDLCIVSPLG